MIFPDTSFLCSLYRRQVFSPLAVSYMDSLRSPLPVSSLLLLEFRQSLRMQVRLWSNDRTRGFSGREAEQMRADLDADLRSKVLAIRSVDWAEVHQLAEDLSSRYTEQHGHRLVDIMHVATAMHLEAESFLTFDANQRRLAKSQGMKVPL